MLCCLRFTQTWWWSIRSLSLHHVLIHVTWTLKWGDKQMYIAVGVVAFYPRLSPCNNLATSIKIFSNYMCFMPYSNSYNKVQAHYKWIISNWASHAHYSPFVKGPCQDRPFMPITTHWTWTLILLQRIATCLIHLEIFLTYVGFVIPY